MLDYEVPKIAHILAATLLFGTGLGSAFQMWRAHRSGRVEAIAVVSRSVVVADWLFTATSALVLPATGVWMALSLGYGFDSDWIVLSLALYALAGACWLPVVWLQIRMARMARRAVATGTPLPPAYHHCFRAWFVLGWPAFTAVIAMIHLMVIKPEL